MAMIMATAGFGELHEEDLAKRVSHCPSTTATLEAVYDGIRTSDLGGSAQTTEFTVEVIRRVRAKLDVWAALL